MGDKPHKHIPSKLQDVGKEITVRVLSVDNRSLEFTKKDELMKEDTPIYQSYKEVKKGDKIVGVVVSKTEHGYVLRTFGGIKGLLTFDDVKEKTEENYKVG